MKIGHCTELLLSLISRFKEDQKFDGWELEHSFNLPDTWIIKNPINSVQHIQIKIHGSGLNIDIITEGKPERMCFWLSSDEHLPQLDTFLDTYLGWTPFK